MEIYALKQTLLDCPSNCTAKLWRFKKSICQSLFFQITFRALKLMPLLKTTLNCFKWIATKSTKAVISLLNSVRSLRLTPNSTTCWKLIRKEELLSKLTRLMTLIFRIFLIFRSSTQTKMTNWIRESPISLFWKWLTILSFQK